MKLASSKGHLNFSDYSSIQLLLAIERSGIMDATAKHGKESHHIYLLWLKPQTGNATPPWLLRPFGVRSGAIGVAIKNQSDLTRKEQPELKNIEGNTLTGR